MASTADEVWQLLGELIAAQKETERVIKEQSQETERRFQETERRFQETERRFQETERIMREQSQETERRFQETERRFQETESRFQETDRQIQQLSQEVTRVSQEVTRVSQEVEKVSQEVSRVSQEVEKVSQEVSRVSKEMGKLGGKWGLFVENMVAPACETLFVNRGIPVSQVSQRVKRRLEGDTLEIDVLVTNKDHVLVVEVKSSLKVDDIKQLMEDLSQFRQFFPEHSQKQLYGAVAGIEIESGADKYAYRQGLFVLGQSGEMVTILNGADFQPKVW